MGRRGLLAPGARLCPGAPGRSPQPAGVWPRSLCAPAAVGGFSYKAPRGVKMKSGAANRAEKPGTFYFTLFFMTSSSDAFISRPTGVPPSAGAAAACRAARRRLWRLAGGGWRCRAATWRRLSLPAPLCWLRGERPRGADLRRYAQKPDPHACPPGARGRLGRGDAVCSGRLHSTTPAAFPC